MSDAFDQFILLLASLKLSERDTFKLVERIRYTDPYEIMLLTKEVRSFVRYKMPSSTFDEPVRIRSLPREHLSSNESSVGERVQRLLKDEAGLSTANAVELLSDALVSEQLIAAREIPPLSRKSLANWVDRVISNVAPKDMLRVATLLRNKIAHAPSTGWLKS
ncbi:hypothetical protein QE400_003654 [Xanthomonas sacchari]|uniref:hypothetical protein n=1 Tax=Xanthomonas sacchari TaxID=56458 RepID=UPI00278357D0|nr:hypothetical protein [Xanthomonas sacchari]MDQ1094241.1 hypothetical protein [Xanthomonas sacchari]